jgi:serine/threonine protein kinase/signal transduction histidine kinase/tetratricopeptide (TPR) repeat protein
MDDVQSRYDVLNTIAKSRNSVVNLVRQKETGDLYLLKSIKQESNNPTGITNTKRYFREMEIVASLDHPNIAKPYEAGIDNDTFSIIYPYEKGDTLGRLFEIEERFEEYEALHIIKQILSALSYLHGRSIIHCDVNPHNIFITETKGVKLLDFGLSMTEEEARKVPEGRITGTFPYLSPEQMGFTQFKIDTRTDLYCAMILLYRMAAGNHPFAMKEDSLKELLDATVRRDYVAIKHVPKMLNMILMKGLRPTPSERYQTAEGLLADISFAIDHIKSVQQTDFIAGKKDAIAAINRKRLFVLREEEIVLLCEGLGELSKGHQKSFLIYGRSGIGKTEMVREFKSHIDETKFDFISAQCNRFSPTQPYSIFRRLIVDLLVKLSDSDAGTKECLKGAIKSQLSDYSGIICRIVPEMREWFEAINDIDIIQKEKETDRVIHVLSVLFLTLSKTRRIVAFIDDFQWIDRISLEAIKRIIELKVPCLIVSNYRTGEKEESLFTFGQNMRTLGFKRLIYVKPFTANETKVLIRHRFGSMKRGDELGDALFAKTEGIPFVLNEAIRYLVNNSFLQVGRLGWTFDPGIIDALPTKFDIVSLILEKVNDLTAEDKRFLQLASLIEGKFDCDIVEKVGNLAPHSTQVSANRLENLGFISMLLRGGYTIIHDRVKESIIEGIDPDEKFVLFERLAEIYTEMTDRDKEKIFNAAECYLKSSNIIKAMETCYQAGLIASENVAFDVAVKYFKNALMMAELGVSKEMQPVIDEIKVKMAMGDVLTLTGANEQALRIFLDLQEKLPTASDPVQNFEIQYKIGSIYHNLGDFEKSAACFKKALRAMGTRIPEVRFKLLAVLIVAISLQILLSCGLRRFIPKRNHKLDLMKARILNKLSYSLYFSDMLSAFYVHFTALNLADMLTDCYEKAEAYSLHQVPIYQMWMKRRAFRYFKEAAKTSGKIHRVDGIAFAQAFGGAAYYYNAQWKKSEELLTSSNNNYRKIGDSSGQLINLKHLWKVNMMRGKFDGQTIRYLTEAIDIGNRAKEQFYYIVALSALNNIKLLTTCGHDEKEYDDIERRLKDVSTFLFEIEVDYYVLNTEILLGKFEKAYDRAKRLLPLTLTKSINSEYQVGSYASFCRLVIQEILNREKGCSKINAPERELWSKLTRYLFINGACCLSYPAYWGAFYRNLAWFFAIRKFKRVAAVVFRKAIKCHHRRDMRYDEACSIRDYALFLDDFCNQPGKARDQFNIAYELFSWCGAKFETDRLESRIHPSIKQADIEKSSEEAASKARETESGSSSDINQVRMDALLALCSSLTEMDDTTILLKQILSAMINATGAKYGCLVLMPSANYNYASPAMSFEGGDIAIDTIPILNRLVDMVYETKTIQFYEESCVEEPGSKTGGNNCRSDMCVPLKWREKLLGHVYLFNDKVRGLFGEGAKKAAEILAAQAGIALENAHLMNQYKELNVELKHKVSEQMNDILEKNKQLEDNTLKLVDSERMKNLLTGALVHDIKNYVTAIQGNIKLFEMKYPANEKVKRTSTIVTNSCIDILNLTSNLLDIAKMEEGKFEVKKELLTIDHIGAMIDKCRTNDIFTQREISIEVKLPESRFEIEADYDLMERVLQNLFSNAVKYSPKGGRIVLSFAAGVAENIITFFNSGTPIPEGSKDNIFEKYGRLNDKNTQYSKGLGLFFCRMVLNAHEGRIWVETDGSGNYFKMAFRTANYHLLQKGNVAVQEPEKSAKDIMEDFAHAG